MGPDKEPAPYSLDSMEEGAELNLFYLACAFAEAAPHHELHGGSANVPHSFDAKRFVQVMATGTARLQNSKTNDGPITKYFSPCQNTLGPYPRLPHHKGRIHFDLKNPINLERQSEIADRDKKLNWVSEIFCQHWGMSNE